MEGSFHASLPHLAGTQMTQRCVLARMTRISFAAKQSLGRRDDAMVCDGDEVRHSLMGTGFVPEHIAPAQGGGPQGSASQGTYPLVCGKACAPHLLRTCPLHFAPACRASPAWAGRRIAVIAGVVKRGCGAQCASPMPYALCTGDPEPFDCSLFGLLDNVPICVLVPPSL
eukprot:538847-Pelagomonas_calceolata.AAC.3